MYTLSNGCQQLPPSALGDKSDGNFLNVTWAKREVHKQLISSGLKSFRKVEVGTAETVELSYWFKPFFHVVEI